MLKNIDFIADVLPCSSSDYPGCLSTVLFTSKGCNFNCPTCHNHKLLDKEYVKGLRKLDPQKTLAWLKTRKPFIRAVSITGGEPTNVKLEDMTELILALKKLGLKVKFDTNGMRPEYIESIIGLVDIVAVDIKGPFSHYDYLAGGKNFDQDHPPVLSESDGSRYKNNLIKIFELASLHTDKFMFRTTLVPLLGGHCNENCDAETYEKLDFTEAKEAITKLCSTFGLENHTFQPYNNPSEER